MVAWGNQIIYNSPMYWKVTRIPPIACATHIVHSLGVWIIGYTVQVSHQEVPLERSPMSSVQVWEVGDLDSIRIDQFHFDVTI